MNVDQHLGLRTRTDRVLFALIQSEIDLAFSLLRLAEAEIRGGEDAHAPDLVAWACTTHRAALSYRDDLPVCESTRKFLLGVGELFEAIRAVERLRQAQADKSQRYQAISTPACGGNRRQR